MTTYEFHCASCGRRFERELPRGGEPTCPHCYGPARRTQAGAGVALSQCLVQHDGGGRFTITLPWGEVLHVRTDPPLAEPPYEGLTRPMPDTGEAVQ